MTGEAGIFEALLFAAPGGAQSPQMLLANEAEQFRPHRPGVLLDEAEQFLHTLVIELNLGAEELVQ